MAVQSVSSGSWAQLAGRHSQGRMKESKKLTTPVGQACGTRRHAHLRRNLGTAWWGPPLQEQEAAIKADCEAG